MQVPVETNCPGSSAMPMGAQAFGDSDLQFLVAVESGPKAFGVTTASPARAHARR